MFGQMTELQFLVQASRTETSADKNFTGYLEINQQNRGEFKLPRVVEFAKSQNALAGMIGREPIFSEQSVNDVMLEINYIFDNLIRKAKDEIILHQKKGLEPNYFGLKRLLYMRNRVVINPIMPPNAGGYYDYQPFPDNKFLPNIEAGGDYLALSPLVFFWGKDLLARVLIHELLHAGAHPNAVAPVVEESITDTVALNTATELGYNPAQTGYQDLIKELSQYLEGISMSELLAAITSDPRESLRNILKLLLIKNNVAYGNWLSMKDTDLRYRMLLGLKGLRKLLPRLFNSVYDTSAGIHDNSASEAINMQNILSNDLNNPSLLIEQILNEGMAPDFWHWVFSQMNMSKGLSAGELNEFGLFNKLIATLKQLGFYQIAEIMKISGLGTDDTSPAALFKKYALDSITKAIMLDPTTENNSHPKTVDVES